MPNISKEVEGLLRKGRSYAGRSKYREAVAFYEKALALDPGNQECGSWDVGAGKRSQDIGTEIGAAISQISAVSNTLLRIAPPGTQPPNVIQFNASNVPVAQLTMSSKNLPEEKIFDYGLIRPFSSCR